MPKIRVLAAEDDELHADSLRMIIEDLSYELIAVVDNPAELLRLFKTTSPDVLLMDIDLGEEETGIDLVNRINEVTNIPVIYLTSFKDEATFKKARETMPEAYLHKPYTRESLQSAVELAVFRKQKEASYLQRKSQSNTPNNVVFVKEGNTLIKMNLNDIALVEAYDKYCYLYNKEKKHLLTIQLKKLLQLLPPARFLQVHRSYIVNIESINAIRLQQNMLEVAGHLVPVSKTYKDSLLSQLKML